MNNLLSEHDQELFSKFQKLITDASPTADLMFNEYFGSTFDAAPLKPLRVLNEQWYTAFYSFQNEPLNTSFELFRSVNKSFIEKITGNIFSKGKKNTLYHFGDRDDDNEERIESIVKEVNDLARKWCQTYNHFIRTYIASKTGSPAPKIETDEFDQDRDSHRMSESDVLSSIHTLETDVHDDWLGAFCKDEYLPLIKLATPQYRGDYHVIAWAKLKRHSLIKPFSSIFDIKLFVAEGNTSSFRTYRKADPVYCIRFCYSVLADRDVEIFKIFPNKIEVKFLGSKLDDGKLMMYGLEDGVSICQASTTERAALKHITPEYFPDEEDRFVPLPLPNTPTESLTRPCRILTGEDATSRAWRMLFSQQKFKSCGESFYCASLPCWGGDRYTCVGIRTNHDKINGKKRYHFTLLLTSFPAIDYNRVALLLSVFAPDQEDDLGYICEGEIARPVRFDCGKNTLMDSSSKKEWDVLDWDIRCDFEKEESELFDIYFQGASKPVDSAPPEPFEKQTSKKPRDTSERKRYSWSDETKKEVSDFFCSYRRIHNGVGKTLNVYLAFRKAKPSSFITTEAAFKKCVATCKKTQSPNGELYIGTFRKKRKPAGKQRQ